MKKKTTLPPLVLPLGSDVHGDISIVVNSGLQAAIFINAVKERMKAYADDPTDLDTATDALNNIRVGIRLGKDAPEVLCGPITSISPTEVNLNEATVINLHF